MNRTSILLASLALGAAPGLLRAQAPLLEPLLRQASAEAKWDAANPFRVDLDGDGQPDFLVLGRTKDRILLAAFTSPLGMASRAQIIPFTLDPKRPTGLCTEHPVLEAESLDFDPERTPIGELPGFTRSKVAQGVKVGGGTCPPFHLYWDVQARDLKYWRR